MIYLAHFSFDVFDEKRRHGYFTCVVEDQDFKGALEKTRTLLTDLEHRQRVLETPASIYLDDLIEVHKVPSEGFLAHMITSEGPLKDAESHSLPGVDKSFCRSYSVVSTQEDRATAEISPFITFERSE
jgi:hypothetical protein